MFDWYQVFAGARKLIDGHALPCGETTDALHIASAAIAKMDVLLMLVASGRNKLDNLSKPEKIYCDNPNLMWALSSDPNSGTMRETFFVNQLRAAGHSVLLPAQGDYTVDGRWLFEVGGKTKRFTQIKDIPESYVVNDEVENTEGNKIPLWLFGFLY